MEILSHPASFACKGDMAAVRLKSPGRAVAAFGLRGDRPKGVVSKTWIEDNGTEASGSESRIRDA